MTLPGAGDGVLLVDKPAGPTSHDVVRMARRGLEVRRVGHSGTLDPFASGLLLLLVGRSTRLAQYMDAFPKTYEAEAFLGRLTTTLDTEGEVVEERSGWERLTSDQAREALAHLVGPQEQVPPAFSAKKVKGEAAYVRARRGERVDLPPVPIRVHEMELIALELPRLRFRVRSSTGTYIRALARDLGERLGTVAHLTALRRTAIGPFRVDDALSPEELDRPAAVKRAWISPLEALAHLPRLEVSMEQARTLISGQVLPLDRSEVPPEGGPVAVAAGGELLAVGEMAGRSVRPRKVFPPPGDPS